MEQWLIFRIVIELKKLSIHKNSSHLLWESTQILRIGFTKISSALKTISSKWAILSPKSARMPESFNPWRRDSQKSLRLPHPIFKPYTLTWAKFQPNGSPMSKNNSNLWKTWATFYPIGLPNLIPFLKNLIMLKNLWNKLRKWMKSLNSNSKSISTKKALKNGTISSYKTLSAITKSKKCS